VARVIGWKGDYVSLFRYALYHDVEETITGDVPGPAKRAAWNNSNARDHIRPVIQRKFGCDVAECIYEVDDEIKMIVSFADSVEEVAYLMEERMSGNALWIASVFDEAILRMTNKWWKLPADPTTLVEKEKFVRSITTIQSEAPELLRDGVLG
jgi:5'-deoxynucleotidase YfbR-like HD superfamily hydrolase